MASNRLELRGLDPQTDHDLFREAYDWRTGPRERISFETFTANDSSQAVVGLFNGEFLAVYMVKEYTPRYYDMHFTAKRHVPREYLVAGGIQLTNWLIENGAIEVSAIIKARNKALRKFLKDCGYTLERELTFSNQPWLRYVA